MSKTTKRIFLTFLIWLLFLGAAAFGVLGYLRPYWQAENTMPASGTVVLTRLEDDSLQITWPRGINAQRHRLEILRPGDTGTDETQSREEVLYSVCIEEGTAALLPALPEGEPLTIRISSVRDYFFPFEKMPRERFGEQTMEITGIFRTPEIRDLSWSADAEEKTVDVQFELPPNSVAQLCHLEDDGTFRPVDTLNTGQLTLQFGENEAYDVPAVGGSHTFAFNVWTEGDGYRYYGTRSGDFTITREDLLGTILHLNCIDEGNHVFTFTWNETKGDHYELQQYDDEMLEWVTLCQIEQGEPRQYTTGHLHRYTEFRFRVVAVGGQTLPGSSYAAVPDEVQVSTGATAVYATVWPIQTLEIYSSVGKENSIGAAPAAQAFCVLDVEDGMFRIRSETGEEGYIDSRYCMINLPEFLGELCLYDIVNSYDSRYMAHEYELPTVTGEVITGYERVRLGESAYLVPLLYPTALKLEQAAFAAAEQGYRLKIYDSYRPRVATRALYDQAITLADEPVPEKTWSGKTMNDLPEMAQDTVLTYEILMTDFGRYSMDYFLASTGSRHNQGVAMDLTLAGLWDGEDLEMQTSIHDLSWYSELGRNNSNADRLADIMTGAGFTGLISEWWHFQDDEARYELDLPYLWSGVTPECWMADDAGWRYRCADGTCLTDTVCTIDGVEYRFDENGYVLADETRGE